MIDFNNLRKTVIVITGMPYMNQDLVAKALEEHCKIPSVSLEECERELFKEYGFLHLYEKSNLKAMAVKKVQAISTKLLREDISFAIVGSLDDQWQDWFKIIKDLYGYNVFVVNCSTKSFDDMYEQVLNCLDIDDCSLKSDLASKYVDNVIWIPEDTPTYDLKAALEVLYRIGEYTRLVGDMIATDQEVLDALI